jgi:hypothetical protein
MDAALDHVRVLTNFSLFFTMTTFVNTTDLEIEEAMDELDEEEMTPINEGVSELIDDLNLSGRLVLLSRRSTRSSRRSTRSSRRRTRSSGRRTRRIQESCVNFFTERLKDSLDVSEPYAT